jgi:group I intron endonuclease
MSLDTQSGIYKIINKINGNFYIGSSVNIQNRWNNHIKSANGVGKYPIHNAIRKYGIENFEFTILESCSTDELMKKEQKFLDAVVGLPNCYNIANFAHAPMLGKKHTEKTLLKISKNRTLATTEETRYKVGSSWRGKKQPKTMVEKRANALRGRKYTNEHKISLSNGALKRYDADGRQYPSLINTHTGEIIPAGKNFRRMCREKNLPHINLIRIMSDVKKVSYGWRVL